MQRVAVVGSGPAAFYAVQRLLTKLPASVDIFERLPVPFGLSRFGVAPDHPEVKNCQERFTQVAESLQVKFFGNVHIGRDISVSDLLERYNAVLFAYGAQLDRRLDIPGSQHPAVKSARDFVGWYNGDPEYQQQWDFSGVETVSIIGNGNVALDVARILLRDHKQLASTDITSTAIDSLSRANIKHVNVVGRRGVLNSAFTNKELRELMAESGVAFKPLDVDELTKYSGVLGRAEKRKLDLLRKGSKTAFGESEKSWALEFLRSPTEFVASSKTHLDSIKYCINTLDGPIANPCAVPTEEIVTEPTDMAFFSIGYKGIPLPGLNEAGIPFDTNKGIIPTSMGRVQGTNAFAAGWIKNGPQGVIVSTMMDGYAVGEEIAEFLQQNEALKPGVGEMLRDHQVVDWAGWKQIDAEEIRRGGDLGKPREKFTRVEDMLRVL